MCLISTYVAGKRDIVGQYITEFQRRPRTTAYLSNVDKEQALPFPAPCWIQQLSKTTDSRDSVGTRRTKRPSFCKGCSSRLRTAAGVSPASNHAKCVLVECCLNGCQSATDHTSSLRETVSISPYCGRDLTTGGLLDESDHRQRWRIYALTFARRRKAVGRPTHGRH